MNAHGETWTAESALQAMSLGAAMVWESGVVAALHKAIAIVRLHPELIAALDNSRDYITSELTHERAAFKGYEHASHIPSIEADLKLVDDLLARAHALGEER